MYCYGEKLLDQNEKNLERIFRLNLLQTIILLYCIILSKLFAKKIDTQNNLYEKKKNSNSVYTLPNTHKKISDSPPACYLLQVPVAGVIYI